MARSPRLLAQPDWTLTCEEGVLVLSGGADALYAFPDLDRATASTLASAWAAGGLDVDCVDPEARDVALRLRDLGALRGEPRDVTSLRFELRFVGASLPELSRRLADEGMACVESDPELVVLVRTNAELKDACGLEYGKLRTPHLLLDLGFRHTISLGPLVFPGETACLGCLVGRIAHYWGDARPPSTPAVQRHASLAGALLALELEHFAGGDYRLVNETVSLSLERLETSRGSVYRLPWCPVCGSDETPIGSVPLPWDDRA